MGLAKLRGADTTADGVGAREVEHSEVERIMTIGFEKRSETEVKAEMAAFPGLAGNIPKSQYVQFRAA